MSVTLPRPFRSRLTSFMVNPMLAGLFGTLIVVLDAVWRLPLWWDVIAIPLLAIALVSGVWTYRIANDSLVGGPFGAAWTTIALNDIETAKVGPVAFGPYGNTAGVMLTLVTESDKPQYRFLSSSAFLGVENRTHWVESINQNRVRL